MVTFADLRRWEPGGLASASADLRSDLKALEKANASASDFFPLLVSRIGASQIAWGSNHPASPGGLKSLLDRARAALSDVSAEDRAWIFGGTAQRLYPVLSETSGAEARHG